MANFLGIDPEHSLKKQDGERIKRNGTQYETQWFDEYDNSRRLIARFRTWTNQAMQPPYRKQTGWERYSLSGNLLDREVFYSKRTTEEYIH